MQDQMPQPSMGYKERLSTVERFLGPTLPKGRDEWYNKIRPLMGKELSLGILEKTDIGGYLLTVQCARMFLLHGQEITGRGIMTDMIAELKLSGSIDGTMVENIFREKIQYEQTQHVHEHTEPQPRKKWIGGK